MIFYDAEDEEEIDEYWMGWNEERKSFFWFDAIGRDLLFRALDFLLEDRPGWDYAIETLKKRFRILSVLLRDWQSQKHFWESQTHFLFNIKLDSSERQMVSLALALYAVHEKADFCVIHEIVNNMGTNKEFDDFFSIHYDRKEPF